MKKRRSSEQTPIDFKNNPFKRLKGFTPRSGSGNEQGGNRVTSSKREITKEDERALFLNAVEGTRRIDKTHPCITPTGQRKDKESRSEGDEDNLFFAAMQQIGATSKSEPEEEGTRSRSTTNRMRLLKRGAVHISQELDLHGFLRDEALQRLHTFIMHAYNRGLKAVLVITGKGINSPEGPVLQGAVNTWLRTEGRGMVAEFSTAPRERGGKGAFVVFLKKK